MKLIVRFALILAGSAALPVCWSAQGPGGLAAAPPAPAADSTNRLGPRIQFNTENYDFEKIIAGEPVKYTFVAVNTGDETLEISNARGSCTCTVVGEGAARNAWSLQKVAPGQTCRIPVEIATDNYGGQAIAKFVTVNSNDKTRPVVNLQVHGNVWVPVEVTPVMAVFNLTANTATNSTQAIKIINRTETPLTLFDPQSTNSAFSAILKTNVPGQEFELTVTAAPASGLPPFFGVKSIQGEILLRTSVAILNPLKISVFETIYPEITIYPPDLPLPAGPLAQPSTNHIAIRGNLADLKLSNPGASVPGVEVSVLAIQTNRQYYLSAVFPKGFAIQPGQAIVLTVQTDNPRFPLLTVPVTPIPGGSDNRPPAVPPPARTTVLPASILARVPASSTNAPAPSSNAPVRLNPPPP
jgi:hypothetical protein